MSKNDFAKQFKKASKTQQAREIAGKLCDHCLGRQFAHISTGMTNEERGKIIRELVRVAQPKRCSLCSNFFDDLEKYADIVVRKLKGIESRTFVVGTKLSAKLIRAEESLWEENGIEYCEPLKLEINREIGKLIEKKTKKMFKPENPDIRIILNLESGKVETEITPLYIFGKYSKLVRGIPQTKWDKYKVTVEDIIARPFMKETKASGHSFHGLGREDIDARCLGKRPFVLEIENPKKRTINLARMRAAINKTGKVVVTPLKFTDKRMVRKIKSMRLDKTYRAIIEFERPVKDIEAIRSIKDIKQKTPTRVLHRRADLDRRRKVRSIKIRKITDKKFEIEIKAEAGLYIKELITGDNGRTRPSISGLLKNKAKVLELDVIKIWDH